MSTTYTSSRAALASITAVPLPLSLADSSTDRVAKPGLTRAASALCGVLAFEQHLGLGFALVGGVGWLIGADHVSFLARRYLGTPLDRRLARHQPRNPLLGYAHARIRRWIAVPATMRRTSYLRFTVLNLIGALAWGTAFVWCGYLLAHSLADGTFEPQAIAAVFAICVAMLWLDAGLGTMTTTVIGSRQQTGSGTQPSKTPRRHRVRQHQRRRQLRTFDFECMGSE